jgi:hypothetical protein
MTAPTEIAIFLTAPACLYPLVLGLLRAFPSGPVARVGTGLCRAIGTAVVLGTLTSCRAGLGMGTRSLGSAAGSMAFLFAGALGVALAVSAFRVKAGAVTDGRIVRWLLAAPLVLFFVDMGAQEVRAIRRRSNSSIARAHLERVLEAQRQY